MTRQQSPFDKLIAGFDHALRTSLSTPPHTRENPAASEATCELSEKERKHIAGLMRVNHAGEIAAQALYQGQSIGSRDARVRDIMHQAAVEENDHLAWTKERVEELGDHTSYLAPLWYAGSFSIGALAGLMGDKWSLGFVAETEHQVANHLQNHLDQIPDKDTRSRVILETMKDDETHHATVAVQNGARKLPRPVQSLMAMMSKVMTKTAYYL